MAVALGDFYAGVFANDDGWADEILGAAEASGDHLWRMPLHPRYRRYVDSKFADLKNSSILARGRRPRSRPSSCRSSPATGRGRTSTSPGPAFLDRSRGDYLWQPGGTGYGVRLIAELAVTPRRMNFDLSEEHELIRDTVREFARERVAPVAEELDREQRFPYELVAEIAELGLMGIPIPEEYGGARRATRSRTRSRSRS